MAHLPAGVAAFIAMSGAVGPVILYADCLTRRQRQMARLMAIVAVVRTKLPYAVILTKDVHEVIERMAA